MNITSKSARVSLVAAALAVLFWTAKAVAIGVAGGLDKSPLESPLFLAGLISFTVALVSLGVALTRGRPAWLRGVAGVLAVVAGVAVTFALDSAIVAMQPADPSWVWAELQLWLQAPLALGAAWLVARRRQVA